MWFGNSLLAIGRGKTILLMMRQDADFISHWREFLNLPAFQLKMVNFYTLLYTIRFMGTMGQEPPGGSFPEDYPEDSEHRAASGTHRP